MPLPPEAPLTSTSIDVIPNGTVQLKKSAVPGKVIVQVEPEQTGVGLLATALAGVVTTKVVKVPANSVVVKALKSSERMANRIYLIIRYLLAATERNI